MHASSLLPRLLAPPRLALAPDASASAPVPAGSSASSEATPAPAPAGAELCTVAAGCFWGVEALYRRHFGARGLLDVRVGYAGGAVDRPSYRAVCAGATGHAEAARLLFDPARLDYRQLVEFFFRVHDPTTPDRQGPDRGSQYRSALFTHGPRQLRVARRVARAAARQWWRAPVITQILTAGPWWDAEDYHQRYLDRNPAGYECPSHYLRDFPPLRYDEKDDDEDPAT